MLIDFDSVHRTYLIGRSEAGAWRFTPANRSEPRKGIYLSSHQVFSNNALQIALSLYNSTDFAGHCVGVNHCLYLLFSRKQDGKYLLTNDNARLSFHLDLGVAADLYNLAVGHCDTFSIRVVRSGKAPKSIAGKAHYRDGRRAVYLRADSSKDGRPVSVEVELDRASTIALSAHCVGYGRLLYPALSDAAVLSLISNAPSNFRACAENSNTHLPSDIHPSTTPDRDSSTPAHPHPVGGTSSPTLAVSKLRSAVWAIGNQKWPRMELQALQAIQRLEDMAQLQALVDRGNKGDFSGWDAFLT